MWPLKRKDHLPVDTRYKLIGDDGFTVILHCPKAIKPSAINEASEERNQFWNGSRTDSKKAAVLRSLSALHQVGVSMMSLSLKWDGLVDLSLGEVPHRICRSIPDPNVATVFPVDEIFEVQRAHNKLLDKLLRATAVDENNVLNDTLVKKGAQKLLNGRETAKWTSKLTLEYSIHKSARLVMSEDLGNFSDIAPLGTSLENVLIPRLIDVHKTFFWSVQDEAEAEGIGKTKFNVDAEFCKALMRPQRNDNGEVKGLNFPVSKTEFVRAVAMNSVCLTLSRPQQALVAYNVVSDYVSNDAGVKQPVNGQYSTIDMICAHLLASMVQPQEDGGCKESASGFKMALSDLTKGIPTMLAKTKSNIRTTFSRMREPKKTKLKWSCLSEFIQSYCDKNGIELNDWMHREVFSILLNAFDLQHEVVGHSSSFSKLFSSSMTIGSTSSIVCGTLIIDQGVPGGNMLCSEDQQYVKTWDGHGFQLERVSGRKDHFRIGDQVSVPLSRSSNDVERKYTAVLSEGTVIL